MAADSAAGAPELTPTESMALCAIAYLQPATRAEISRMAGKEAGCYVIGRLKRLGLVDGALRAPEPGAPFAYMTTRKFLEAIGLASPRELPDLDQLQGEGLLRQAASEAALDDALGVGEDDLERLEDDGDEPWSA